VRLMRQSALAVAGVTALATLAACGGTSGGGASGGGTISVVMAGYSSKTQPYWTALVSRFEKSHPRIKVNLRVIDWNTLLQQVPTMIQTGSYPDVLNFNAYSTFASSGLLRPASQVLSPAVLGNFLPAFRANDSIKGTEYGIPWIASVRALGYNKQAFAKAHIMSPPVTWADYVTDAKRKRRPNGRCGCGRMAAAGPRRPASGRSTARRTRRR